MKTTSTKLDLTPTIRVVNGKPVNFYSPQQIEQLVEVDKRLAPTSNTGSIFNSTKSSMSTRHIPN